MKIMVLGSSGHIGSALVKKLREDKANTVIKWDIKDKPTMHDLTLGALGHTLYSAMNEVDYVYFLAKDNSSDPMKELDTDLRIIINVFQALDATKKPFMFASHVLDVMPPRISDIAKLIGNQYAVQRGGSVYSFASREKVDDVEKALAIDELIALLPK